MKRLLTLLLLLPALVALTQTYDGYTLYSKMGNTKTYLLKMDKTIYHQWNHSIQTGYSSYLLPNQVLLRSAVYSGNQLSGAAMCGMVQKVDWNGNVLWQYVYSSSSYCTHHDICPMPNGNVLLISYEVKSASEVTQAGCSQNIIMWPDKIVEVQPSGTNGGNIVWEWHAWDHLCQSYNAAKDNYVSSVAQHPELININYNTTKDWMHTNGLDYNPELDQIVFSSHNLNEMYVIDHSTTTAEAATHTGGNSGKGGDILYRWGNPAAYSCGTTANQIFHVVHDAHWIDAGCPNANDLVGFNNQGATGGHSCVDRFTPPYNGYTYTGTAGTAYTPSTYNYRHVCLGDAGNQSNSQQLPNGNTLVCIATSGYIYEIDANQTLLWSYTAGGTVPKAFRYTDCYVNGNLGVDATASPGSICSGSSTQLGAVMTNGTATSYNWTSVPAGFTSTAQNPVVSPTVNTWYYVTASSGTCSATDSVYVSVQSPITASAAALPASLCAGQSSQLSASSPGCSTCTYSWTSNPAGFTSTTQNPVVSPTVTTTYTVTVNNGTCTSTANTTVTVNNPFTLNATSQPGEICSGATAQLDAVVTGTGSFTYSWTSVPVGFSSTLQNPVVSPTENTQYTVVVSDGTCSLNASTQVAVDGPLSASASANPAQVCLGQATQLTANANGGSNYQYAWTSDPAGFTSNLQNPSVSPLANTTYYLIVYSGPCTSNAQTAVTVNPVPELPVITRQHDTLFSSAANGNQWYLNGGILVGQTQPRLVLTQNGNYQVETTNSFGCPSGLSVAYNYVYQSLPELQTALSIYPNPSSGWIHIKGFSGNPQLSTLQLYDGTGREWVNMPFNEKIDLSWLEPGLYFLVIQQKGEGAIKMPLYLK